MPDYMLADGGGFISAQRTFARTTLNAGARYDIRQLQTEALPGEGMAAFNATFHAFTGSAGFTWQPDSLWNLRFNAGRGFRAPNIAELASHGLHEGTFR